MIIKIDYCPSPSKSYFISTPINKKEAISFDNTIKGFRIIKQILIDHKKFPKNKKPTQEWDTIILINREFKEKYHVKWIDMDKKDWANDEIWECIWEKPIPKSIDRKMLFYSRLISDNYKDLKKFNTELKDFEKLMKELVLKYNG